MSHRGILWDTDLSNSSLNPCPVFTCPIALQANLPPLSWPHPECNKHGGSAICAQAEVLEVLLVLSPRTSSPNPAKTLGVFSYSFIREPIRQRLPTRCVSGRQQDRTQRENGARGTDVHRARQREGSCAARDVCSNVTLRPSQDARGRDLHSEASAVLSYQGIAPHCFLQQSDSSRNSKESPGLSFGKKHLK